MDDAAIERILRRRIPNPVTLKTHLSRMSSIKTRMGMSSIVEVLRHPDDVGRALTLAGENPRTSTNTVTTLLTVMKHAGDDGARRLVPDGTRKKWLSLHSDLQRAQDAIYRQNQPLNDRQRVNYVGIDEVRVKVDELRSLADGGDPHATLRRSMALLLFAFYAYLTPKRSDLGALRVFRGAPRDGGNNKYDGNFVVLPKKDGDEGVLVIRRHKTAASTHDIAEAMPPTLVRMVKESLDKHPRDFVFVDRDGRPYSNNAYTKFVIRTFADHFGGRKAGTALLRHAYVTDQVDFNKMSLEERERIARLMGHDVKMQGLVYKWVRSPSPEFVSSDWAPISVVDNLDGTRCVCMRRRSPPPPPPFG